MSVNYALKNQLDLPVFESCRFLPAATPATSALVSSKVPGYRYLYALSAQSMWRYDTWKDVWIQVAPPNFAPLNIAGMFFISKGNSYGKNIRSLNASTMQVTSFAKEKVVGETILIINGSGLGQVRTIASATDPVIADHGVITGVTGTTAITDSTKKWDINQWTGYHCKLVFGTGSPQFRKILYNDATTLTIGDPNWQQLFPSGDLGWSSVAPYAAPVIVAGSQAHYFIESMTITVDTPWTVTPSNSSIFAIQAGLIPMITGTAAAPFYSIQVYDILPDMWNNRSACTGSTFPATVSTDLSIVSTYPSTLSSTALDEGTVTSAATRTLTDTTKTWTVDQWVNYKVAITGGYGIGQSGRIVGNTVDTVEIAMKWAAPPNGTSTYTLNPDKDNFYFMGGGAYSTILMYSTAADQMFQGLHYTYGLARSLAIKPAGFDAIGVTTAVRQTNGVTAVNATPTAPGINYVVGDVLTIAGGTNAKVIVTGTTTGGGVTSISLQACGTGYGVAAGQNVTGGAGTSCTVEVTSVGTIGLITTAFNHAFKTGDTGTFSGDLLWAGAYTIIAVPSLTTVCIVITAAGDAVATTAITTSNLVDCNANWTVNEHVGRIVQIGTVGTSGTVVTRRITANTAKVLTLQTAIAVAAVNGTSRYVIHDVRCMGRAEQYKVPAKNGRGYATGGTSSTLVDSTKNWNGDQWAGYKLRVYAGTGIDFNDILITGNTPTTLNLSSPGFTPDTTTKYWIMDTVGVLTTVGNVTNAVLTDTTKNWTVNQWAGKIVRINSGTGQSIEKTITSNTATALTLSGVYVTPPLANESTYCIVDTYPRGTGASARWLEFATPASGLNKFIISIRGGATNDIDVYDITTELWNLSYVLLPQSETFTTGTESTYDLDSSIFIQKDTTGRVFQMNFATGDMDSFGTIPWVAGVAVSGNRMCTTLTADGVKYMYILKHSGAVAGTEFYRSLIY